MFGTDGEIPQFLRKKKRVGNVYLSIRMTCLNVFHNIWNLTPSVCTLLFRLWRQSERDKNGKLPQGAAVRKEEEKERENKKIKEQKNSTGEQEKGSWLPVPRGGRGLTR